MSWIKGVFIYTTKHAKMVSLHVLGIPASSALKFKKKTKHFACYDSSSLFS